LIQSVNLLCCGVKPQDNLRGEEEGMEGLLNNLTATVIAGFVLTLILAIVIHAMA